MTEQPLIAYDSARPKLIPATAAAVLVYGDGHFAWHHSEFPKAAYRYFTVQGDPKYDIADVEPGCIWPPTAARSWALRRSIKQLDITAYCDRDTVPALAEALDGLDWHLGLATLDGSQPTSYQGIPCRFVQYTDRNNAYDQSIVYDPAWLHKPL